MTSSFSGRDIVHTKRDDWDALIGRAKDGCPDSFEEIVEQFYSYLLLTAKNQLSGQLQQKMGASDIVQSGLFRAFGSIGEFKGATEIEFRVWLRTIVLNSLNSQRRRYSSQKRTLDREHNFGDMSSVPAGVTPCDAAAQEEERLLLKSLVSQLPAIEQQVLKMRYSYGYPLQQVSEILRVSQSRVRRLNQKAVKQLKIWLADHDASSTARDYH